VALYEHLVRSGRAIPTIFMTAFPDETLRRQALASGVISYLIKPCDEDTLLACIRSVLND
jgi:DNA-binding response OmpR family regulator